MERPLGALEHSFWLYDQIHPIHFALTARLEGQFDLDRLRQSLQQAQQQHPLLRVRIETDRTGQPKFVEQTAEIPLRIVDRLDDRQWEQELEVELSRSFHWMTAPLVRVVVLHSQRISELIVTCHHAIADGLSMAYLIRDIVRGLEMPSQKQRHLSESLAIEHLIPDTYKLDTAVYNTEQMAPTETQCDYNFEVSTRSRPHIRTVLLSVELTQWLHRRCREEATSVHSAISAAFLLALSSRKQSPSSLKCLSPVSVREHLSQSVGESVGLYVAFAVTNHDLNLDACLWETARSLKSQLSEAATPQRLFAEARYRQAAIAKLPKAEMVVQGMRQQRRYDLLVTNLGRLHLEQQFGTLRIAEFYGPTVMSEVEQERVVGVATLGDRLSLTVAFPSATTSDAEATEFLAEALQILRQDKGLPPIDRSIPRALANVAIA